MDSPGTSPSRRDEGWVLASVVVATGILFMLVTMLIGSVAQHTLETKRYQARTTAMHVADAGVNAYMYAFKHGSGVYIPTLGPTAVDQGTWTVTATPPDPVTNTPLRLRSVGVVPGLEATRAILAEVRRPTYADYSVLIDDDYALGTGGTILGKLRANGNVDNDGTITGRAEASGSFSGSGQYLGDPPKTGGLPKVDFAQVTADINAIRTKATAIGTFYAASGARGYRVTITGTSVQIDKVTAVNNSTGALTTTAYATTSVPADGVFYFNDTVWVRGTYSAALTISATKFVLPYNLRPQSEQAVHVLGLISSSDITFPLWYSAAEFPTDVWCQAALLAQNGGIGAEFRTGSYKNSIMIRGSRAFRTLVGFESGSSEFHTRTYEYDKRLEGTPPPMYPQIKDGTYKVSSWLEGSSS